MNRINRRTVLKGLGGITIGLPLLEEMAGTSAVAAGAKAVPVRAFNVFFGLGIPAPLQTEGIGGVLEPPNAVPVVIGDDCLIGSRCIVAEGARVGDGVVLGAGAILTGSIPVIDAATGEELCRGEVPAWCVAVQATRPRRFEGGEFGMPCVLVLKHLDPGERHDKSALNDILRTHGVTT